MLSMGKQKIKDIRGKLLHHTQSWKNISNKFVEDVFSLFVKLLTVADPRFPIRVPMLWAVSTIYFVIFSPENPMISRKI